MSKNPKADRTVLHARPIKEPVDFNRLIDEFIKRYPKTLAYLAKFDGPRSKKAR